MHLPLFAAFTKMASQFNLFRTVMTLIFLNKGFMTPIKRVENGTYAIYIEPLWQTLGSEKSSPSDPTRPVP